MGLSLVVLLAKSKSPMLEMATKQRSKSKPPKFKLLNATQPSRPPPVAAASMKYSRHKQALLTTGGVTNRPDEPNGPIPPWGAHSYAPCWHEPECVRWACPERASGFRPRTHVENRRGWTT